MLTLFSLVSAPTGVTSFMSKSHSQRSGAEEAPAEQDDSSETEQPCPFQQV